MANAKIGNYVFNIDPSNASWSYKLKTNVENTYGGKVIQILSCSIENLKISGHITSKGTAGNQFKNLEEFERKVLNIMSYHERTKLPVKFNYPVLDWSGDVFLTGYSDVEYNIANNTAEYVLSFEVDSGFKTIQEHASSEGLDKIPDGVNWTRNEFNTPTDSSWETAKKALEKVLTAAGNFESGELPDTYDYMKALVEEEKKFNAEDKYSQVQIPEGGYLGLYNKVSKLSPKSDLKAGVQPEKTHTDRLLGL